MRRNESRIAPRARHALIATILTGVLVLAGSGLNVHASAEPALPDAVALLLDGDHTPDEDDHGELDATSIIWHTQSRGNRGNDVKTIQYLLRHRGHSVAVDGIFGSGTESAVKSFQSANGLTADGIVGANTWSKLIVTAKRGASGDHVRAIQNLLNQKKSSGLSVDGAFGSATESAVKSFQSHMGITSDGIVGSATWKRLVWHYERPNTGLASVCAYGSSSARWGTAAAVGQLEAAAQAFYGRGDGPVAVGDLSLQHGGDIAGHASHEVGLDVDLRPIRTDNGQCSNACYYTWSCYDKYATLALCQQIRSKASGHVKLVLFNDPYVRSNCPATYYDNHDNHLHVRYCEKVHWSSSYDC